MFQRWSTEWHAILGGFSLQEIIVDAKSKKMGRDHVFLCVFPWGYDLCCSWSIWVNDHHILHHDMLLMTWMSVFLQLVSTRVVLVPHCFVSCWSCQPATIWRRKSEDLTQTKIWRRYGVEKKHNHSPEIPYTKSYRKNTHIHYKKTTSKFNLNFSGHFRSGGVKHAGFFCVKLQKVGCL